MIGKTAGYKLIQGHIPYGTHLNLGLRSARYFSFLRNPVERHFSDVAHGLRDNTHGFHALLTVLEEKPLGWASVADQAIYYRNPATHYLSGVFFTKDVDHSDFQRAAQAVIECEFVGLAERFNESILIMARKLGWSQVVYEKRNVSPNPLKQAITPESRKVCAARLLFDIALYQIACERFEEEARSHGAHLQEAAQQLEELVSLQSKAFPELEKREYLVGDPVSTHETLGRTYPASSPLALWLKGDEKRRPVSNQSPLLQPVQTQDFVLA
jgi:hypothetical protein